MTNAKDGSKVASGTNVANGSITFDKISYTPASLLADLRANPVRVERTVASDDTYTYTYTYQIAEDAPTISGVAAKTDPQTVTVTVVDKGDGTPLAVSTSQAAGSSFEFKNVYGESETDKVDVSGTKTLAYASEKLRAAAKVTQASIKDDYTFKITALTEGAPMPSKADKDGIAHMDETGAVDFGTLSFSMASVFGESASGADGTRTKTYEYQVEELGSRAGVTNDANATQTFTVTVRDNGDGTITATSSADKDGQPGAEFAFTNTYGPDPTEVVPTDDPSYDPDDNPSGSTNKFTVTKRLDAAEGTDRPLVAGEFHFELVENVSGTAGEGEAGEGEATTEKVIATGTNDAGG